MRRLGLFLVLLDLGCYAPQIKDGDFVCGPDRLCPSGFVCGGDNHCYRPGSVPTPMGDMAMTGPYVGNGLLGALDLSGMAGKLVCDTDKGTMTFFDAAGAPHDVPLPATAGGFQQLKQASGPEVAIWSFTRLVIPPGLTVQPASSSKRVLVLAANDSLTMRGTINWSGFGEIGGAPGMNAVDRNDAQRVGGGGAMLDTNGSGGGGGGYGSDGTTGSGAGGGKGGPASGAPDLLQVLFGMGGGGGGAAKPNESVAGPGGNGGGAVALFARALTIGGTIDVTGAVGVTPSGSGLPPGVTVPVGGGGGGAGGSILLGGATLVFEQPSDGAGGSGSRLVATGGKGGAGLGGGGMGGNGGVGRIAISYSSTISGTPNATPTESQLRNAITQFPR